MAEAGHEGPAGADPVTVATVDTMAPAEPTRRAGQAPPAARHAPLPYRIAREAGWLTVFLAAGVAATWPRAAYLTGRLPSSRDSATYVWGFWWVARQLTHLHNPWFTDHLAAPAGVQLGFHAVMPLPGVLLAPVTRAFGPSVSCNLLVAAMPGLLCYTMYRAARLWLRSGIAAAVAGAFFGLSAMLTEQDWYHLNIAAGALFLPLALEASVRLRRTAGRREALILGLIMGAAALTDQESSLLAALVTGLVLLPWLLRQPSRRNLWPAALAVAAGTVAASPQIVAMVAEIRVGGLAIPPAKLAVSYKQYGIGLPGMFTPTPRVADFGARSLAAPFLHGRDNEGMPMFGTVLSLLALLGLVAARRRSSAWLLAGLWAGCAALALGASLWIGKHQYLPLASWWHHVRVSNVMPYTWFVRLPGLSGFREADRLAILGLMPAALLAGAAVDWLRYHAWPVIALVVVLGALEAGYSGNPHVGTMPTSYPRLDHAIAADHKHSLVLDVPFGLRGGIPVWGVPFFPQALVMATGDGHPRSIAYVSRVPRPAIAAMAAHPFYRFLVKVQHQVPRVCPWNPEVNDPPFRLGCPHPRGVARATSLQFSKAQLTAARRDAARMRLRWAVVWKRNLSVDSILLPYLRATGFRYAYRDHNWLVYSSAVGDR